MLGISTGPMSKLDLAEKSYGRVAMISIFILAGIEFGTGHTILGELSKLDLPSIWWALGIYAA